MSRFQYSGSLAVFLLLFIQYFSGIAAICIMLSFHDVLDGIPANIMSLVLSGSVVAGIIGFAGLATATAFAARTAFRQQTWKIMAVRSADFLLQIALGLCPLFLMIKGYSCVQYFGLAPFLTTLVWFLGFGLHRQTVVGCFSGEIKCA